MLVHCRVVWQYKAKTLDPRWLEQFDLYMYDDQTNQLEINVFDHDVSGRDDFMGRSVLAPGINIITTFDLWIISLLALLFLLVDGLQKKRKTPSVRHRVMRFSTKCSERNCLHDNGQCLNMAVSLFCRWEVNYLKKKQN